MAVTAARRSRKGLQGFLRRVVLGGLLVAAVVIGLLAMHTLNLHGTAAAHAPAVISVSTSDAVGAHHGAAGTHESGGTASDLGGTCADRKSTRLNSSHVAISYAVFCLKKKNTHTQR